MTTRLLLAALLLGSTTTLAQARDDDAPIPYDDDSSVENPRAPKKAKHLRRDPQDDDDDDEAQKDREPSLAHLDDPNIGLAFEFLAGAMLFESSRGALVDPRFMYGARFTWEYGRLIPDEFLREVFFADVTWQYAATHDGTTMVNADSNSHYFTISPAFALPFGKSFLSAYAQVGAGFNFTYSALHIDTTETNISGAKFLFQYGLGLRGRPAVIASGAVRISFRVEVTRFIRGYLHDTFVGGSVGVNF